jgi:hypothetical protein
MYGPGHVVAFWRDPPPRPNLDEDDVVDPILMGYLCRRLGLDPAVFGYTLESSE